MEHHHVRGQLFHFFHPGGQGFHRNIALGAHFPAFHGEVALGLGTAEKHQALGLLRLGEGVGLEGSQFHLTAQHLALAGATGPVTTAVGHDQTLAQRRVQEAFLPFRRELMFAGFNADLEAHFPSYSPWRLPCPRPAYPAAEVG